VTTFLLDVNILIALIDPNHIHTNAVRDGRKSLHLIG
jgi:hypothetical protein